MTDATGRYNRIGKSIETDQAWSFANNKENYGRITHAMTEMENKMTKFGFVSEDSERVF